MPIEILPAGWPDWIQFDTTGDLSFLAEDPHWQTKVGSSDPEKAILYRGNNSDPNFTKLEMSEDGGKTWTQIVLPDTIDWYKGATFTHLSPPGYGLTYEPTPKIDPSLSRPHVNHLTIHAYAGDPTNSGIHAVLCSHNYEDGVDTGWDLNSMWVAYTFNDWQIIQWQQVLPEMEYWTAPVTEGSSTNLVTAGANLPTGWSMAKISDTKIAAFWWTGGAYGPRTVRAYHLTPGASTFTVDGSATQSNIFHGGRYASHSENGHEISFVYGTSVYSGEIVAITDGYAPGIDSYRARVHEWSFASTTPVYVGVTESSDLPQYGSTYDDGNGSTWLMTGNGRLAFYYTMEYDIKITGDDNPRQVWLFYFDCFSDVFSTPYLYMEGDGLTGVPRGYDIWFSAAVYNGSNKALVCETYCVTWTNRLKWDWHGKLHMMDIGGWYKHDEVELFEYLETSYDQTNGYRTYVNNAKLLDHDRFAFGHDRGGVVIAHYSPSYNQISEVYEKLPSDNYGVSSVAPKLMMQDDPVSDKIYISGNLYGTNTSRMMYSKWSTNRPSYPRDPYAGVKDTGDDFRHKVAPWSDTHSDYAHVAFGDHDKYGQIWYTGSGPYDVKVSMVTVGSRPVSDKIFSRYHLGPMGFNTNGSRLYFGTGDINATNTAIDTYLEYLTKNPSSPDYSTTDILGYNNNFGYGFRSSPYLWGDIDIGVSFTDFANGESYFGISPWPEETDGIIMWGRLEYARTPTNPDQIKVYSTATNWDIVWDNGHAAGYTDPVRAVVYYGGLIYAAIKSSTGIKFYVSDAPPYGTNGDYMNFLSDSILADCGIGAMDYDGVDGSMVIAQKVANLLMVALTPPPYTSWYNITLSHRNDLGVTGLVVL